MTQFIPTQQVPPPEGVLIEAKDEKGFSYQLFRKGEQYFFRGATMIKHYPPVAWRNIAR